MRKLVVVLIACLLTGLPATAGPKSSKEQDELAGPVRTVTIEKVQMTRQFGKFLGRFLPKWVEGQHVRIYSVTYDARGNKTNEQWYNPDGSLNRRVQFTYDASGNLTETIRYKADGSVAGRAVYAYDGKGNKTEEKVYKADGSLDKRSEFTYQFDGHGNWVKKTEVTRFETEAEEQTYWSEAIYRTITYH